MAQPSFVLLRLGRGIGFSGLLVWCVWWLILRAIDDVV